MSRTFLTAPALPGDPNKDARAATAVHGPLLGGIVYANALITVEKLFGNLDLGQSALVFVRNYVEGMSPRDPAEELLVVQLILTHARILHLTHLATRTQRPGEVKELNAAADAATATYRELMTSLAAYRREGGESRGPTVSIGQANIGGQQVIQNGVLTGMAGAIPVETNKDAARRPYRLSAEGLESLRASARRVRPWERATGPRTEAGKRISSRNAAKG